MPCIVRWPGRIPAGTTSAELATALDLLPTIARAAGARSPEQTIDGRDITSVLDGTGPSPHQAFLYYEMAGLAAVRSGGWKLHLARRRQQVEELYDLTADVGETTDVSADHPDVVASLTRVAAEARRELGDSRLGITGRAVRAAGSVADPVPLTRYDPDHPYYAHEYDLTDRG